MTDTHDIQDLMRLEDTLKRATDALNQAIIEESDLELVLIKELKNAPIKDTLSIRNKFIQLRCITRDNVVEGYVDDWLRAGVKVRTGKYTLRQVEGRRDSLKKKIGVEPH